MTSNEILSLAWKCETFPSGTSFLFINLCIAHVALFPINESCHVTYPISIQIWGCPHGQTGRWSQLKFEKCQIKMCLSCQSSSRSIAYTNDVTDCNWVNGQLHRRQLYHSDSYPNYDISLSLNRSYILKIQHTVSSQKQGNIINLNNLVVKTCTSRVSFINLGLPSIPVFIRNGSILQHTAFWFVLKRKNITN